MFQLNLCAYLEHFPNQTRLRAGVYFVDSLPKTSNGKLVHREITKLASEMFDVAKQSDPEIQSYFSDIPAEFEKLIQLSNISLKK